mgnify:FL=1
MSIFDIPKQLVELDTEIKRVKNDHEETVEELRSTVKRLNALDNYDTFSQYQSDYDDAMALADIETELRQEHNSLVEEYNQLAERVRA